MDLLPWCALWETLHPSLDIFSFASLSASCLPSMIFPSSMALIWMLHPFKWQKYFTCYFVHFLLRPLFTPCLSRTSVLVFSRNTKYEKLAKQAGIKYSRPNRPFSNRENLHKLIFIAYCDSGIDTFWHWYRSLYNVISLCDLCLKKNHNIYGDIRMNESEPWTNILKKTNHYDYTEPSPYRWVNYDESPTPSVLYLYGVSTLVSSHPTLDIVQPQVMFSSSGVVSFWSHS